MVRAKATRENMFVDRSLYRKSVSKRGRFGADFFTQHHSRSISCSNFEPRNSALRWVKIYYRGRREWFKMRAHESHWQDYSNLDPCPDLTLQIDHRLTIHGPSAGIGWNWVSIPVVDIRRLGFKSPVFSMPCSSDIRQKKWWQKTDEKVANDTKMGWGWNVTATSSKYNIVVKHWQGHGLLFKISNNGFWNSTLVHNMYNPIRGLLWSDC